MSIRETILGRILYFRAFSPFSPMPFGGLAKSVNAQTRGALMEKARTSGEHYFRIKILHQHRLTFPTCVPAPAATVSANLQETVGLTGAFSAFRGFLRISQDIEGGFW